MPGFEPEMLHETAEAVVPGSNPASITVRKKILRIGRSLCSVYTVLFNLREEKETTT